MWHRQDLSDALKCVQSFRMLSSTRLSAKSDNAQMSIVFLQYSVECNYVKLILRGKDSSRSVQGRHVYRRTVAYGVFSSPKARGSLVSGVSFHAMPFTGNPYLILRVEVDPTVYMLVNYLTNNGYLTRQSVPLAIESNVT